MRTPVERHKLRLSDGFTQDWDGKVLGSMQNFLWPSGSFCRPKLCGNRKLEAEAVKPQTRTMDLCIKRALRPWVTDPDRNSFCASHANGPCGQLSMT